MNGAVETDDDIRTVYLSLLNNAFNPGNNETDNFDRRDGLNGFHKHG